MDIKTKKLVSEGKFIKSIFSGVKYKLKTNINVIIIVLGLLVFIQTYCFFTSSNYYIHKFQKDFVKSDKSYEEIEKDGFEMMDVAKNHIDCWDATRAMFLTMNRHPDYTRLEVVQASNDILWKACQ